jgi:hypothetical protein
MTTFVVELFCGDGEMNQNNSLWITQHLSTGYPQEGVSYPQSRVSKKCYAGQ